MNLCTKISYASKHEAKSMLSCARTSISSARAEQRVYRCDRCRTYHLTSMTIEEYERKKAMGEIK